MMDHWVNSGEKVIRWGYVRHKVWRAHGMSVFYANSGLDVHGPYDTSMDAIKACDKIDDNLKEPSGD